ncbi:hypothetical protein PSHT_04613 [Puccinia striiformis]|uniref:Uncharacterized protein n=1 Tax=Puccinia striiformis TaxID=27350 RepID=A0A2S4WCI5_9BASI|nr:hypothetical protein PSHT_04613 [Puccinia striiformis]
MKPTILCSAAIMIQGAYCESEAPFVCKNNPAKTKPWCARYHKGVAGGASPYYELTPTKGKPKDGNPACPDLATCCKPNVCLMIFFIFSSILSHPATEN